LQLKWFLLESNFSRAGGHLRFPAPASAKIDNQGVNTRLKIHHRNGCLAGHFEGMENAHIQIAHIPG
jgi:hypothetical protein